jgi:Holliday junction resolvase-like predicted endonuclease
MLSKHDTICEKVANELSKRGWYVTTNKPYHTSHCGEIDVIGYKDTYVMYVEVKCNLSHKNYQKALSQLRRANNYCPFHKSKRLFLLIAHEYENKVQYKKVINNG